MVVKLEIPLKIVWYRKIVNHESGRSNQIDKLYLVIYIS